MINGGLTDFAEDAIRDWALTQLATPFIGFFSDTPTDTGGTELSGNGYARVACPLEVSGNSTLTNNGAVTGATPSGTWTRAKGFKIYDGASGNAWMHGELIGSPQQITEANINTGTDVITISNHGLADNTLVVVRNEGGALPGGLSAATEYYIISSTTHTFELSETEGGAAVDITDTGSGIHRIFKCYFQTANPTSVIQIPDNALTFTFD